MVKGVKERTHVVGGKKAKLRVFVKAERDFTSGYCSTGSNKSQAVQEIFLQGKAWLLEVSKRGCWQHWIQPKLAGQGSGRI